MTYASVHAQNVLKHFTIEDGLPSNEVHYVHQDGSGYFWFCTDRGISKYNGYDFVNFTTADGLTSNTVFKCFEDRYANLWFTMVDGSVTIYDRQKHTFRAFAGNSLIRKRYERQRWVHHIGFKQNSDEVYFFMVENRLEDSVHVFKREQYQYSRSGTNLLEDESLSFDNMILVSLRQLLAKNIFLVIHKEHYTPHEVSRRVKSSFIDFVSKNNARLGVYPAAYLIDSVLYIRAENESYSLMMNGKSKSVFKDIAVTGVTRDREDMYWVTSRNEGVYIYSNSDVVTVSSELSIPKNRKLTCAASLGQEVLVGTDNSLIYRISAAGSLEKEYSLNRKQLISNKLGRKIRTFWHNSDSTMLYFYDFEITLKKSSYQHYSRPLEEMTFKPFRFYHDDLGKYIDNSTYDKSTRLKMEHSVAESARLHSYPLIERLLEMGRYYDFSAKIARSNSLPSYLMQDSCIYFATDEGLIKFYLFKDETEKIDVGFEDKNTGISDFKVLGNVILLATKGHGLLLVEDDKVIKELTIADGLLANMVNAIWIDKKRKRLWLGTTKGVSLFEYEETDHGMEFNKYKDLTKMDGLFSNYVVSIAATSAKTFVVSDLGLTILSSDLKRARIPAPKVNLLGIQQGDSLYVGDEIYFDPDQNNVEFRYVAVSNKKVKDMYRYRLMSLKDSGDWFTTDQTSVRFNNLAPARYTFQVSARAQNTDWSVPEEYHFEVASRFIDLWWVRALGLVMLLAAGYLVFYLRLKRVKDRDSLIISNQELELQVAKMESSSLRGQMNPHFTFNVLNSIQKLVLNEEKQDANKLLSRFSKLVRSALRYSRLEYISLAEEVKFLDNYLRIESQRFPDRFTHQIEVADELLSDAMIPPLLIQPLCENAIKHAFIKDGGTIWVRISVVDNELMQVVVEDDGVGVVSSNMLKKSSLGTTIIRDRLKLIDKNESRASLKIEIANKNTTSGTRATLILPYS